MKSDFWIKNGFLNPSQGVVRLTPATDYSAEYFSHARLVNPAFDALVLEMVEALRALRSHYPANNILAKYDAYVKGREG